MTGKVTTYNRIGWCLNPYITRLAYLNQKSNLLNKLRRCCGFCWQPPSEEYLQTRFNAVLVQVESRFSLCTIVVGEAH
jgi:hypothetical protein